MTDFANIFFPSQRITYPTVKNPVYIDDIKASNQLALDGLSAVLGLLGQTTGFLILSGLTFDNVNLVYSAGYIWLNGQFYYVNASFAQGLYLTPAPQDVAPQPFAPANNLMPTYTNLLATSTAAGGAATSPVFNGNMSAYRAGSYALLQNMTFVLNVISTLGTAAYLNVGTAANTVASGNDPRLVGNLAFFDGRYSQHSQVIEKNGGVAYTPVAGTDPVNVNYVANNFIKKLASGSVPVGDIPTGGKSVGIAFGVTLPNTNYIVLLMVQSNGTPSSDASLHVPAIYGQTTEGCQVYLQEGIGLSQNITLFYIVLGL